MTHTLYIAKKYSHPFQRRRANSRRHNPQLTRVRDALPPGGGAHASCRRPAGNPIGTTAEEDDQDGVR